MKDKISSTIKRIDSFNERNFRYISLIPALLILLVIVVYPLTKMITTAFTDLNAFNLHNGKVSFVGFKNFVKLFSDRVFLTSLWHTLKFSIISSIFQTLIGVMIAYLVYPMPKLVKNIVVTALLVPSMVADASTGLVWSTLLNHSTGVINYFLEVLGIGRINFLGSSQWALPTITFISIWQWYPYMFLFALAGFEGINKTHIEAARLDGCTDFQVFFHIALPSIAPILSVALFFRMTNSIRVFDKVYILTGGGPGTATEFISTYIQKKGFVQFNLGLSSAGGIVMLLISFLFGAFFLRYMYKASRI